MTKPCAVIVIGGSAGALDALAELVGALPADCAVPVVVVLHVRPDRPSLLESVLAGRGRLAVREAEDKAPLSARTIHVAPPNYHLLLERRGCLSLSVDPPQRFSRPSIDVTFESAADAFGDGVVAVLLSGASDDGAQGLARIAAKGGMTMVQDPASAEARTMPEAALAAMKPDHVLAPKQLGAILAELVGIREAEAP